MKVNQWLSRRLTDYFKAEESAVRDVELGFPELAKSCLQKWCFGFLQNRCVEGMCYGVSLACSTGDIPGLAGNLGCCESRKAFGLSFTGS